MLSDDIVEWERLNEYELYLLPDDVRVVVENGAVLFRPIGDWYFARKAEVDKRRKDFNERLQETP